MKYILLIYDDEQVRVKSSEAERTQMYGEYAQLTQQIQSGGQYVAGSGLQPTATATSVRVRDGQRLLTDGPFAETREQLGGYYLVDARDLDEAISIAARIPSARQGTAEVRPLMVMPAPAKARTDRTGLAANGAFSEPRKKFSVLSSETQIKQIQ